MILVIIVLIKRSSFSTSLEANTLQSFALPNFRFFGLVGCWVPMFSRALLFSLTFSRHFGTIKAIV